MIKYIKKYISHGFFVASLLSLSACNEIVSTKYHYLTEVPENDRCWLPPLLPKNCYEMKINNDLDLNKSEGSFKFGTLDLDRYIKEVIDNGYNVNEKEDEISILIDNGQFKWSIKVTKKLSIANYKMTPSLAR